MAFSSTTTLFKFYEPISDKDFMNVTMVMRVTAQYRFFYDEVLNN